MWVVGRFIKWEKRILPVPRPAAAQQQNARGSVVAAQHALDGGVVEAAAQGEADIGQEAPVAREAETAAEVEAQQEAAEMGRQQGEVAGGPLIRAEGFAQMRQGADQALPTPQAALGQAVAPELLMPWCTRDSIMSKKRAEQIAAEAGDAF